MRTLDVQTSSLNVDTGNLVLLLKLARERWWRKWSLGLLGPGEDNSQQLNGLIRSQTLMLQLIKYIVTPLPGKDGHFCLLPLC